MSKSNTALKEKDKTKQRRLMSMLARSRTATQAPEKIGNCFFYMIEDSWEARVMERDEDICKAVSASDLEKAFSRTHIKRILIPRGAYITKDMAKKICEKQPEGKTIYFESKSNG